MTAPDVVPHESPTATTAFHAPRTERLMVLLLPAPYRDELVGDLLEEARTVVMPRVGEQAARRWLWGQLLRSTPHMLRLHLRKELTMRNEKLWGMVLILVMGSLQAWDSGVLRAPAYIAAMVALAITIGVVALLFAERMGMRFIASAVAFALLFGARMLSPIPLPELGLVGFIIVMILVIAPGILAARQNGPQGPTSAA